MIYTQYKGFVARIEHSIEDGVFVGEVIGITDLICFHGETENQVIEVFHAMIDDYLNAIDILRGNGFKESVTIMHH